jgi:hypothetical protein
MIYIFFDLLLPIITTQPFQHELGPTFSQTFSLETWAGFREGYRPPVGLGSVSISQFYYCRVIRQEFILSLIR